MANGPEGGVISSLGRFTVLVDDQQAALEWYRSVLDFDVLHDSTESGHRYLHIGARGQHDVGLWLMPTSEASRITGDQADGAPLLVVYTDDLDRLVRRLESRGVEYWDLRDDPGSRSLHFRDLLGNVLVAAQLQPEG